MDEKKTRTRTCLKCDRKFESSGPENWLYPKCKPQGLSILGSLEESYGDRRSGGRSYTKKAGI